MVTRPKKLPASQPRTVRAVTSPAGDRSKAAINWLLPIGVAVVTGLIFCPVLKNGFVNFDDPDTLLYNSKYQGLAWSNQRWMFTDSTFESFAGFYGPLTWISFALDYLLWGLNPVGYHLTSLVLHVVNAVLLYFLALKLFGLAAENRRPQTEVTIRISAAATALLFAVHPLRVEPVAGATARNHLLSLSFLLGSVLLYLNYVKASKHKLAWFIASTIAFVFSLLSNSMGMTLPFVLLLIDYYPLKRLAFGKTAQFSAANLQVLWEKLPYFVLASAAGVMAIVARRYAGLLVPADDLGFFARVAQALYALAFYIWKTVFPTGLSVLYEMPAPSTVLQWQFLGSGIFILSVTLIAIAIFPRWSWALVSWLCYLVTLGPVSGVFGRIGPNVVADRYSYLSCLVWAILAGAACFALISAKEKARIGAAVFNLIVGVSAIVVIVFGVLTEKQIEVWRDSETLWKQAVRVNPGSGFAHHYLGAAALSKGDLDSAVEHYRQAVALIPPRYEAHLGSLHMLAQTLAQRGDVAGAISEFRRALDLRPGDAGLHNDLAVALANQGNFAEAVNHFRRAIEISPWDSRPYKNVGIIYAREGRATEAIAYLRRAAELNPADTTAQIDLANSLAKLGDMAGAAKHFRDAIEIDPQLAEAHAGLGRALAAQGDSAEARRHYEEALRLLRAKSQLPPQR
jgi:protein O-mannosyl-transferase